MGNKTWVWGTTVVLALLVGLGGGWVIANNGSQQETVAWVGDESITSEQLGKKLFARYGKVMLDEMINALIIEKEAESLGITISDEELSEEMNKIKEGYRSEEDFYESVQVEFGMTPEELQEDLKLNLLLEKLATKDVHISDAEAQAYYEANEELYYTPESMHLMQIIVESEEAAKQTINELLNGADFSTLAKERSIDVLSASNGGDLGFVSLDDDTLHYEILEAASLLDISEISDPIPLDQGYAVIKLVDRKEGEKTAFEQVKREIIRELALSQVPPLTEVVKQLRDKYKVETVEPSF